MRKLPLAAALVLCVVLLTTHTQARADDSTIGGGPSTHIEMRRDDQFVQDATLSLLSTWIINLWVASIGDLVCNGSCTDHAYDLLYLPLAGPAIAAALPGVQRASTAWSVVLVADSALQVGLGLAALIAYVVPTKHVVVPGSSATRWTVTPGSPGAPVGATLTVLAL